MISPGLDKWTMADFAAVMLSRIFAPVVVVLVSLLIVALDEAKPLLGITYWLLASVFGVLLPVGFVAYGVKKGHLDSLGISVRRQRLVPMCVAILCVSMGGAGLLLLSAPRLLLGMYGSGLALLIILTAVTKWWKISLHSAIASGSVAAFCVVFGAVVLVAAPAVAAVCWARYRLRKHSVTQLVAGVAAGSAVSLILFPVLSGHPI